MFEMDPCDENEKTGTSYQIAGIYYLTCAICYLRTPYLDREGCVFQATQSLNLWIQLEPETFAEAEHIRIQTSRRNKLAIGTQKTFEEHKCLLK